MSILTIKLFGILIGFVLGILVTFMFLTLYAIWRENKWK